MANAYHDRARWKLVNNIAGILMLMWNGNTSCKCGNVEVWKCEYGY